MTSSSRTISGEWLAAGAGLLVLTLVAMLIDHRAVPVLQSAEQGLLESRDSYRLLRVLGYAPTWVGVALVLMLVDARRRIADEIGVAPIWLRGPFLFASAAGAGLLAEGLKLLIRRGRPAGAPPDGYLWVPLSEGPFDSSELGIPSSHAAVAFGAAFALARLHPPTAIVMLPAAIGCALTRAWTGQHYVSDLLGGALVGWLVPTLIVWWHGRR